jgi:hypothetical protein
MIHGFSHEIAELRQVDLDAVNASLRHRKLFRLLIPLSSETCPSLNNLIRLETGVCTRSACPFWSVDLVALNPRSPGRSPLRTRSRTCRQEVKTNKAVTGARASSKFAASNDLFLLDQHVHAHEPKARFVRIELNSRQCLARAVAQTDADVGVRVVAGCRRQSCASPKPGPTFSDSHWVFRSTSANIRSG